MRVEAWVILTLCGLILYLLYRNKSLASQLAVLTHRAWPVSGEIKYPLELKHLLQIANDVIQVFGEDGLHVAMFAVKRTLRKLSLSDDFASELQTKIIGMRFWLGQELQRKEALESHFSASVSDRVLQEDIDRVVDKIMNYTTGLQKAQRLFDSWQKV